MSNKNAHNEQDSNDHSDCQDCRKQKKQNQALINIYQRLQNVNQKVGFMQESIVKHKQSSLDNTAKVKSMQKKVENIKNAKNTQDQQQFQNIGYQLYAQMIEQQQKNKYFQENQRLKKFLKQIYKQKDTGQQNAFKTTGMTNNSSFSSQKTVQNQQQSKMWFNQSLNKGCDPCTPRQSQSGKYTEIFSTKSSFNMTKRKTFNLKQFEQLNLWLFENQNEKLQKQLYEPAIKNNNSNQNDALFQTKSSNRNINKFKDSLNNSHSRVLRNSSYRSSSLNDYKKQKQGSSSLKSPKLPSFNRQKLTKNAQILSSSLSKQSQKQKAENYFSKRVVGHIRGSVLPAIVPNSQK